MPNNCFNLIFPLARFMLLTAFVLRTNRAKPLCGTEMQVKQMLALRRASVNRGLPVGVARFQHGGRKTCAIRRIWVMLRF